MSSTDLPFLLNSVSLLNSFLNLIWYLKNITVTANYVKYLRISAVLTAG